MAGSNMLLAPERGNQFTCSIEVLTFLVDDPPDEDVQVSFTLCAYAPRCANACKNWVQFSQQLLDSWTAMFPDRNLRLHWAKEWENYLINDTPMIEYARTVSYAEQIERFVGIINEQSPNSKQRFSNPLLDKLIFGDNMESQRKLIVNVVNARLNRKCDSFVRICAAQKTKKTRKIFNDRNPEWREKFVLYFRDVEPNDKLTVEVYQSTTFSTINGIAHIPYSNFTAEPHDFVVTLHDNNNEVGTLTIRARVFEGEQEQ